MAGPLQVCSFTSVFSSLATMCPSEVFSFCFIYLFILVFISYFKAQFFEHEVSIFQ